jgi:hypothetical protein
LGRTEKAAALAACLLSRLLCLVLSFEPDSLISRLQ